tara:strand:+ start:77 stop:454 length:378 start_codon:yes stop_codon:yes gene_type:complete
MEFNKLQTMQDIETANPLFFSTACMNLFKSKVYDSVKVFDQGTYFITSEILKYERPNGGSEVIHHEKDRVFKVRFANASGINSIEEFDTLHRAKTYLDKLDHNTGGFTVSQHEANQAKLRLLGVN